MKLNLFILNGHLAGISGDFRGALCTSMYISKWSDKKFFAIGNSLFCFFSVSVFFVGVATTRQKRQLPLLYTCTPDIHTYFCTSLLFVNNMRHSNAKEKKKINNTKKKKTRLTRGTTFNGFYLYLPPSAEVATKCWLEGGRKGRRVWFKL